MIPVRNIYYMLSYAFQVLQEQGYKNIQDEQFENALDMFSSILTKGVTLQIKRGLNKDYQIEKEPLSAIRGKIDITESIKTKIITSTQLVCEYDDFSENSYFNKIVKTTLLLLLKSDISSVRKKEIKNILLFLANVDTLDRNNINWNIRFNKNNQTYRLLLSICRLIIKGLLQSEQAGNSKEMTFLDEQKIHKLYEKFIREYYKKHHPELAASAEQIPWQLDDDYDGMLPTMQSDITLKHGQKVLIIDAKYYTNNLQTRFDAHTINSANLYQIFTYVKNKTIELGEEGGNVSGMLLYAKTDDFVQPGGIYKMSGNTIEVRTLDLNLDFCDIKQQLESIVDAYFQ